MLIILGICDNNGELTMERDPSQIHIVFLSGAQCMMWVTALAELLLEYHGS